jgi:hypothetical protein
MKTGRRRRNVAAFLLVLTATILLIGCGPEGTVEEQKSDIQDLVESTLSTLIGGSASNTGELATGNSAPELSNFSADEMDRLISTIAEMDAAKDVSWEIDEIEIDGAEAFARVRFRRDSSDDDVTIVLPLHWSDDTWAITPKFSVEHHLDYVPIE